MVSDSAALVLFAIRSAIRLGQQMGQAYVESTQRRALVLPLPNYFAEIDAARARNFFLAPENADFADVTVALRRLRQARERGDLADPDRERLADLECLTPCLERVREVLARSREGLTAEEETELVERWCEVREMLRLRRLGTSEGATGAQDRPLAAQEFVALVSVRQWARGEGPPTVLHRMAGTFIGIGADFLRNVPGALDPSSRHARVIGGFLEAMEGIDLAEMPARELPGRLFVATLETLGEHPELVVADERGRELVKSAAAGLASSVSARIAEVRARGGSVLEEDQRMAWGELVFRSLLGSAGRLVLEQPGRFLGVENPGQAALITQVGGAFFDALADAPEGQLHAALSRTTLDRMVRSALGVVAAHPELVGVGEDQPIRGLLQAAAKELSGLDRVLGADVLPVIVGLILDRTADHLEVLWPEFASKPGQHLLLTAAAATLRLVAREPREGRWKVRFSRADGLAIVEVVLDEVVANPAWLTDGARRLDKNLAAALEASLDVLRSRGDERLSSATGRAVLVAAIRAVTLRQEFLQRLPASAPVGGGKPLVAAALDAILAAVFDPELGRPAAWQLMRGMVLKSVVETALGLLARTDLSPAVVEGLSKIVREQAADLAEGAPFDLADFANDLAKELSVTPA